MADTNQDDLFNDPVLYEDNDFKTSLELLNDGAGPFETIDPALTINSPHVHDDFSTDFSTRQSTTVPATQFLQQLSTQSNPNSPQTYSESAPLGFGVSSHIASLPRRSVSQPPEEVTFHRGDHWLGPRVKRHAEAQSSRSRKRTCTNPPGRQEWLSLRNQDFQLLAPTSAPYLSTHLPDHMVPEVQNGLPVAFSGQRGLHPFSPEINFGQRVDTGVGMLISSRNQDATSPRNPGAESMALPREPCSLKDKTLFLGLTVHTLLGCIDRLKAQCDSIKELAQLELYGKFPENDDQLNELCRNIRATNSTIVCLDQKLEMLPRILDSIESPPTWFPTSGNDIRGMGIHEIGKVLDWYQISRPPHEFCFDKKIFYLQYIGASLELMHLVLD